MPLLSSFIVDRARAAIVAAFPLLTPEEIAAALEVTRSTQPQFGHYQLNSAMKLGKLVKMAPRHVAEKLIAQFDAVFPQDAVSYAIAGPGFINFTFMPAWLSRRLNALRGDERYGVPASHILKKVIVDFSSPNVAKEMHVGHLRSTIIGECLARLLEFLGHEVMRYNHIGDWGTAFGMLIAYIRETHPDVLTRPSQQMTLQELMGWYRAAKVRFDEDSDFKTRAQQAVVALQQGDVVSLAVWEAICDVSRRAYEEIYQLLGVRLIERGESFYNPFLADLVQDLKNKGLAVVSEGALCVFSEDFKNREGDALPLMLQKTDGGYTYDTTDMAAIRYRLSVEHADWIIYVTDAGQSSHFQMIFNAAQRAGYWDPSRARLDHVPFGLVLGPDGKKFRTRSGETERLIDLLRTAVERADLLLRERNPELSVTDRTVIAHRLGIGAVKYADLATHRVSDYAFSYDKMLRFEGNTAAFLLYAYVRVEGIKRKVNRPIAEVAKSYAIIVTHPSEIALGVELLRFPEVLLKMEKDLLPHHLTEYLFGLAEQFHAFFRDCRVEGDPAEGSRLLLCDLTAQVLQQGLSILGIETVEKM